MDVARGKKRNVDSSSRKRQGEGSKKSHHRRDCQAPRKDYHSEGSGRGDTSDKGNIACSVNNGSKKCLAVDAPDDAALPAMMYKVRYLLTGNDMNELRGWLEQSQRLLKVCRALQRGQRAPLRKERRERCAHVGSRCGMLPSLHTDDSQCRKLPWMTALVGVVAPGCCWNSARSWRGFVGF